MLAVDPESSVSLTITWKYCHAPERSFAVVVLAESALPATLYDLPKINLVHKPSVVTSG